MRKALADVLCVQGIANEITLKRLDEFVRDTGGDPGWVMCGRRSQGHAR